MTTTKIHERLDEAELTIFKGDEQKGGVPTCPDCGSGLLKGPEGGLSLNVYCENDETCGSKFNYIGPIGVERITDRSPKTNATDTDKANETEETLQSDGTSPLAPIEYLLAEARRLAEAQNSVIYQIMFRNAGVGVEWHEESRCTTAAYHGSDLQVATATGSARTKEGLIVYGYHDDMRTALACELIRLTIGSIDIENEDDRRSAVQTAVWPETASWFGHAASSYQVRRTCIACVQNVGPAAEHSAARERNFWMSTLCDRCQARIGL